MYSKVEVLVFIPPFSVQNWPHIILTVLRRKPTTSNFKYLKYFYFFKYLFLDINDFKNFF